MDIPLTIRTASPEDRAAIAQIQNASPQASQWEPSSGNHCMVALKGTNVLGFLVTRQTAQDEHEILNLAVDPSARRQGVARALLSNFLERAKGAAFLEVRASNSAALALYRAAGFTMAGERKGYYHNPQENGIVMKFVS
jgi:ribosomal-protein-alanine acetyltransferase